MSEQREKQLAFVYSVLAIVVLYCAITYWLPYLRHAVGLHIEKSQVLQAVEGEIQNDQFDVSDLANYKSKAGKLKADAPTRKRGIKPSFVLEKNDAAPKVPNVTQIGAEKVNQSSSVRTLSPGFRLPAYFPAVPRSTAVREVGPVEHPASTVRTTTQSNVTISPQEEPHAPSRYLAGFASDSIEAQLHGSLARRADPFGIHNLQFDPAQLQREAEDEAARRLHERELREQQDLEYRQALQRDNAVRLQEEQDSATERLLEDRIASKRQQLIDLVKPEPEVHEDGCVTLQFRSRHPSTLSGPGARMKRRFNANQYTAQDLLHFVESLELRPLLSPAAASCVLTLDFPTRVVSRETEPEKTLKELGISADSIVWVKFDDE